MYYQVSQQKLFSRLKKSDFCNGSCSCPLQTCTPNSSASSHLPLNRNRATHSTIRAAVLLSTCHRSAIPSGTHSVSLLSMYSDHICPFWWWFYLQTCYSNWFCIGSDLVMFYITFCDPPTTAIYVYFIDPDENTMLFKCKINAK